MERLQLLDGQFRPQLTKFGVNHFAHVQMAPADPILSLTTGFKNDKDAKKVNLGVLLKSSVVKNKQLFGQEESLGQCDGPKFQFPPFTFIVISIISMNFLLLKH